MCDHAVVICGTCDNNCCNGGYGTVNDADCADCPSAYALYYKVAGYLQMTKSNITTAQAASLARDLCGVAMCLDEHEMLETGQLTLYKAAEMLINLLARTEAAEAERDGIALGAQWARNRLDLIADEAWHGDGRDLKRSIIGVFADFDEALTDPARYALIRAEAAEAEVKKWAISSHDQAWKRITAENRK